MLTRLYPYCEWDTKTGFSIVAWFNRTDLKKLNLFAYRVMVRSNTSLSFTYIFFISHKVCETTWYFTKNWIYSKLSCSRDFFVRMLDDGVTVNLNSMFLPWEKSINALLSSLLLLLSLLRISAWGCLNPCQPGIRVLAWYGASGFIAFSSFPLFCLRLIWFIHVGFGLPQRCYLHYICREL